MLILERPWRTQPQCSAALSSEWLSRGLVALFDQRVGRELVQGTLPTASTAASIAAPLGIARDFTGTANVQYAHHSAYAITGPVSIVALLTVDALTNYGAIIAKQATTTTYAPYELRIGLGPTDSKISFLRAYNSNQRTTSTPANVLAAGYSGSLIVTYPTGLSGDLNGKVYTSSSVSTLSNAAGGLAGFAIADDGSSSVYIGRRYDGATQLDGKIYYVALFNREISAAEARWLVDRPWQLFQPRRIYIPTAAAASGAPSITALSAISITATSAQPRISYS